MTEVDQNQQYAPIYLDNSEVTNMCIYGNFTKVNDPAFQLTDHEYSKLNSFYSEVSPVEGYDLIYFGEPEVIMPGSSLKIHTGICVHTYGNYIGLVVPTIPLMDNFYIKLGKDVGVSFNLINRHVHDKISLDYATVVAKLFIVETLRLGTSGL